MFELNFYFFGLEKIQLFFEMYRFNFLSTSVFAYLLGVLVLLLSKPTVYAAISRQECTDQGGTIVGDIGNGAILYVFFFVFCFVKSDHAMVFAC